MADSNQKPEVTMDPAVTTKVQVPLSKLESFITPDDHLFVIGHMGIARVNADTWRLKIEGAVERPLTFDYEQLKKFPSRIVTAFHECYGNPVEPDVPTRRIGNVVWGGVPLHDVLAQAGIRPEATHVWLEGADSGTFAGVYSDRYIKDLPLAKVLQGEVLLAYEMNGAPLSAEHGFPVRAVVVGFFGTNSVKWLSRVYLAKTRPESFYTTRLYNRDVVVGDKTVREPVREVDVHSVMVRPSDGDVLNRGTHRVMGWTWSAYPVVRAEVSTDGGMMWGAAHVDNPEGLHSWQRFVFDWQAPHIGRYELQCRATDARRRVQPPRSGRNRIHAINVVIA